MLVIDLATLNGKNGFRLDGAAPGDSSGFSVSAAGDVNGDGIDDFIVGAYGANPGGRYDTSTVDAGASFVIFGRAGGGFAARLDLGTLDGTNGFRLDGAAALDFSGRSVSAAGDVNGDGVEDFIIGAHFADPEGRTEAGSSFVIFGRSGGGFSARLNLGTLDGTDGFRLDGAATGDLSGFSVAAAGDVNGDGIDDLIVGAVSAAPGGQTRAGSSFVIFGRAGSNFEATLSLSALDGRNGFRLDGAAAYDRSGRSVSAAGDINGDGIDDLIIGAFQANPAGRPNAGASFVIFGRAGDEFEPTLDLGLLTAEQGFRIDGAGEGAKSGYSVSTAGDVNGDGIDDLIIGAFGTDPDTRTYASSSHIVFGRAGGGFGTTLDLSKLTAAQGVRLEVAEASDFSGFSVSAAGDVNGDGIDDVIIGAFGANPDGLIDAGSSYVVFGHSGGGFDASLNLGSLTPAQGFRIDGAMAFDTSGISVSAAGDVNGDGIGDLIVGARGADPDGRTLAGSSYVVFGFRTDIDGPTEGDDLLPGTGGPDRIAALGGDDTVRGLGGDDTLLGQAGDDVLRGGGGTDLLKGGGGADRLLGQIGNDTLRGGVGEDNLVGGAGADRLFGQGASDMMKGGAGADRLVGGAGADSLDGGKGADTMIGGAGADVFRFAPGDGADVIQRFQQGSDLVEFKRGVSGFDALTIEQQGDDVLVTYARGSIRFTDQNAAAFTEDDFLF